MKIFTSAQIHQLDRFTIEHEPIKSIDLMERASRVLTRAITESWPSTMPVVIFAGPGNNGGDAMAVARMLIESGYQVQTFLFNITGRLSADCTESKKRLCDKKGRALFTEITQEFDPPQLGPDMLVIDGLFGSGLNKPLAGGFASLVKYINASKANVVSIDVPSGLMTEDNTYNVSANIIRATQTLTLGQMKLSFLFPENQVHIGEVRILDIKLSKEGIAKTEAPYTLLEEEQVKRILRDRNPFAHKGQMGHALVIAGSYGMAGCAVLAAEACLRSGLGKLTVHTISGNRVILQTSVPEAILHLDSGEECVQTTIQDLSPYQSVGIGPGLGMKASASLKHYLSECELPMVLDADALNILAQNPSWLRKKNCILTPHPGEMRRLASGFGLKGSDMLECATQLAVEKQCLVVLKECPAKICLPDGSVLSCPRGNAGMATAGSGDVLTGIITGLLAQGYTPAEAATLGVWLHATAGDFAAERLGQECLLARDIISFLPQSFSELMKIKNI